VQAESVTDADPMLAGEFGASTRLSPKALRLYAEQGLLTPAYVDPDTGYRRYHSDQIPRARLIGRLRALHLPLSRIAVLLTLSPQARQAELHAWLAAQETELQHRRELVESLDATGSLAVGSPALRTRPQRKLLSRERRLYIDRLPAFIADSREHIRARLRAAGLADDGPMLVHFHGYVTRDSDGPVEVAVPFTGSVEPVDDLRVRLSPAGTDAFVPVAEADAVFPGILRVYDELEAWIDANQLVSTGSPVEIWPGTGGAMLDVTYPVTPLLLAPVLLPPSSSLSERRRAVYPYIGSGPYCYANSLAMVLGLGPSSPSVIEVLTGSPFGIEVIAGQMPLFDPYGWDPDRGIDDAIALLGWTCQRQGADDDEQAIGMLRDALKGGPVLVGPVEMGLFRHQPEMPGGPIGADHFVRVLEADDKLIRFHDPQGFPYATLPAPEFLAAWRADSIPYKTTSYTMRSDFQRVRDVTPEAALRAALPGAVAWLRGRDDLDVPPGTIGGAAAALRIADMVAAGLDDSVHGHLAYFAIKVGTRRLADAADALAGLGQDRAAAIATRQAQLVGSLQYDIVTKANESAAATLRQLAPTYEELAAALIPAAT
jgi:DNA-binding transcriptional MerR regulator